MAEQPDENANRFGTFGGVFTPSILTILGVIMFMRAGFVVGQAGIWHSILILFAATSITLLTALSVGAISTNMKVRGGGAYFMISRVLGVEFGGAIGLALFFAQALSVPFYILGFAEALTRTVPAASDYFLHICLLAAAMLFAVAYIGASWAIKTQYFIMIILILSIIAFMGGAALQFDKATFDTNWISGYTSGESGDFSFWIIFAIYFPAVTGILAGVNMSGDLKDPGKSIPRGTLYAVGVGFFVYLVQIILCGGAFDRADMIKEPYNILHDNALWGAGFLVAAGVFAATLSSALGSFLGAPRILQAVSRDKVLGWLHPFAKGTAKSDEPRRALILTGIITIGVLVWAGKSSGGGALNAVAAVITMFFLYTYGMTNMAAFTEAFGYNPSFRPRFRLFHWTSAFLGALGCIGAAFLINAIAAIAASVILVALLWYLRTRQLQAAFGDARRGFVFASARKSLLRLSRMAEDPKNWRPTILVFSGNPASRESLVRFANWMESGSGIVYLANILIGEFSELAVHRRSALKQLREFCQERSMAAFPISVVAQNVEQGVSMVLQASEGNPIRPNVAFFGWSAESDHAEAFVRQLRVASAMSMSIVLLGGNYEMESSNEIKRIDVWWRGRKNGHLMVILAHLMTRSWDWSHARIRVLRVISNEEGREPAVSSLRELVDEARIDADIEAIVSDREFPEILHGHSSDADCVILGFEVPEDEYVASWQTAYKRMLAEMPPTLLVRSSGGEDMLA